MLTDQLIDSSTLYQTGNNDGAIKKKKKKKNLSLENMTIHAVHETLHEVDEDAISHQPLPRSTSLQQVKPMIQKRSTGNVVLRRKHSVPNMNTQSGHFVQEEKGREGGRRANSFKYYSTGYFFNDIKLPVFSTSPTEIDTLSGITSTENKKEKRKKKTRGLRRTLSMPIFQKQIKGNILSVSDENDVLLYCLVSGEQCVFV